MTPPAKTGALAPVPLEAALAYLAKGWCVIPAAARGKRPKIPWRRFQEQQASYVEVRNWFTRWPDANLAIVTGEVSGIVVLDIDPGHGGEESLSDLMAQHGALPRTVAARTGGGGRHIYFQHPGKPVRNQVGLAPGLDLRGDGGLVIAPPSLHPSGQHYQWVEGQDPDSLPLAPLPRWLLRRLQDHPGRPAHPIAYWRDLARQGVQQGERNNTIASFAGHLFWHGVDQDIVTELLLCWNRERCRPPLSGEEVIRTVESIARTHARQEDGED